MIRWHADVVALLKPLSEIRPHYRDPLTEDIDAVNAQIDRIGVCRPILASRRTGQIVGNRGLYEALLSRGETQGPVIYTDDANDEEELFLLVSLYAITAEAFNDPSLEVPILKELAESDWGLLGTGYDISIFERRAQELEEAMENAFGEGPPVIRCPECNHEFEIDRVR